MRGRRCREGSCLGCTPHTALRDLIGDRACEVWRNRLFAMLVRNGYTTPAAVAAATDDELLAIRNLGEGSLTLLRDALDGLARPAGPPPPSPAERLAAGIEHELRRHLGGGALP